MSRGSERINTYYHRPIETDSLRGDVKIFHAHLTESGKGIFTRKKDSQEDVELTALVRAHNAAEDKMAAALYADGHRAVMRTIPEVLKTNNALPPALRDPNHEKSILNDLMDSPLHHGVVGWMINFFLKRRK